VIRVLKEHPWRSSALVILVVASAALAILYLHSDSEEHDGVAGHPPPVTQANEHANHGAPAPANEHAGHGPSSSGSPAGYAGVMLDPARVNAMGVTTAVIAERDFSRNVRTVGIVTVDETRTAHVHARVRGWIDGFHVQFVGRKVKKGEPLVSIYSQEVYAAQMELVSLLRSSVKSTELLDAARKRLALWEVPRSVIDKIEQTGEPQRTFPVLSPRAGVVVAKQAFEGLSVDSSIELYTITDLSRVWVIADIYEADVANVRIGTLAKLSVEGLSQPVEAKVSFLYPTIDERTRTRKARLELANPKAALMPGAFVTVELTLALDRGLGVPESAVIRTGERAIVFVMHGTHAQPREIKLGARVGNYYRVDAGLAAGEQVATGAQFLLDSESRLQATGGGGGHVH
jgi:Cu(I)/Ag(I) efflux system membrane fusion protein